MMISVLSFMGQTFLLTIGVMFGVTFVNAVYKMFKR